MIDQHAHDKQYVGYRIAFTADWQFIKDYKDGPNAAGSFGRKSYDRHLGLVESLATLYDVTGDVQVRARLDGEVYTALPHDGRIDDMKVDPWKAPYHVTRAFLEIISRLGRTL